MGYESAVVINPVTIVKTGVLSTTMPTTPTATHGNKIPNDGKTYIEVANGAGAPINVTIDTPGTVDGMAIESLIVAVANGTRQKIGPFPLSFNQSDGYVWGVCSSVATITMGAFRLP